MYSIIIPVKSLNHYVRETVAHVLGLNYANWELIILPNEPELSEWSDTRIRIAHTGNVGPARKRDFGAVLSRGDYLVFLDDDSYPCPNYLEVAESYLSDKSIVALGGPGMTPRTDTFWQKVSGAVYLSRFSGGAPERYVSNGRARFVDDWPSVNLIVNRNTFLSIGGFDSPYWPGEDTLFCLKLAERANAKILYIPELLVWHHRRGSLREHLVQVGAYGKHRGFFAREYPENSLRFKYFIPTLFASSLLLAIFLYALGYTFFVYFIILPYLLALALGFGDIRRHETAAVSLTSILIYVPLTHVYYGLMFFIGFSSKRLTSRFR